MRPPYLIAQDIRRDWGKYVSPKAEPYLVRMERFLSIDELGAEEAVAGFLDNARGWCWKRSIGRHTQAARIKRELRRMLKVKTTGHGRWLFQRKQKGW